MLRTACISVLPHLRALWCLSVQQDMQRPLYMQPKDALEYGIIDGIVKPQTEIIDDVMNADQWDKQAGLVAR